MVFKNSVPTENKTKYLTVIKINRERLFNRKLLFTLITIGHP
jgi:hypothetical protein